MPEATVKNVYSSIRGRIGAYGEVLRSYFGNSDSRRKYSSKQETPAKDPHTTPFVAVAIDDAIEKSNAYKTSLSCAFIKFKDEYAIPEIHALLKEAFHANNGFYPSNELRRIGIYEIGLLIHDKMSLVSEKLLGIGEYLSLFNDQEYSFSVSLAEHKKGDGRWDLIQRTQQNRMVFEKSKEATNIALETRVEDAAVSTKQAMAVLQENYDDRTKMLRKLGPLTHDEYDKVIAMNKRNPVSAVA
jgi:hypothetical protein